MRFPLVGRDQTVTIAHFHRLLTSKLTAYDLAAERRAAKAGRSHNVHALGLLFLAAERARTGPHTPPLDAPATRETCDAMVKAMRREFVTGFSPVAATEKQIRLFLAVGRPPSIVRA